MEISAYPPQLYILAYYKKIFCVFSFSWHYCMSAKNEWEGGYMYLRGETKLYTLLFCIFRIVWEPTLLCLGYQLYFPSNPFPSRFPDHKMSDCLIPRVIYIHKSESFVCWNLNFSKKLSIRMWCWNIEKNREPNTRDYATSLTHNTLVIIPKMKPKKTINKIINKEKMRSKQNANLTNQNK